MLIKFLLFSNRLSTSRNFVTILILVIQTCLFSLEQEKNRKLSFLDVEVSREKGQFLTTAYRKPTFSGVYTHFESFFQTVYIFGLVYSLAYRCLFSYLSSKESAIRNHLLNCSKIPSFEEFTILANWNNKFVLEIKESLLFKRDRPILNKNISSTKLFLFDNS